MTALTSIDRPRRAPHRRLQQSHALARNDLRVAIALPLIVELLPLVSICILELAVRLHLSLLKIPKS